MLAYLEYLNLSRIWRICLNLTEKKIGSDVVQFGCFRMATTGFQDICSWSGHPGRRDSRFCRAWVRRRWTRAESNFFGGKVLNSYAWTWRSSEEKVEIFLSEIWREWRHVGSDTCEQKANYDCGQSRERQYSTIFRTSMRV